MRLCTNKSGEAAEWISERPIKDRMIYPAEKG
jgi:hypothetical protein